jgi:WD40 repeat protein
MKGTACAWALGISLLFAAGCATTGGAPDPTIPSPTSLSAAAGDGAVALSWSAPTGAAVTGYQVYRSTTAGAGYTLLTTTSLGAQTTTYTDSTVVNGTTYYYVVRTVTADGQSDDSGEVSATPTAAGTNGGGGSGASGEPSCTPDTSPEPAAQGDYRHWTFDAGASVRGLAFSENGRRLVVGDQAGKVQMFGHTSNKPVWTYQATETQAQFNEVAISADGRTIVATDELSKVYLFQCDSETPVWTYTSPDTSDQLVDVDISADGSVIVAASYSRVYVFDWGSASPRIVFAPTISQGGWLTTVRVSADGGTIAAGTWISDTSGAEVFVFDQAQLLWSYQTPYASQSSNEIEMPLDLSDDGARLAMGGSDKKIHYFSGGPSPLWSYAAGSGTADSVWSLEMSGDGSAVFASAGEDKVVYLSAESQGSPLWTFDGNYGPANSAIFGPADPYSGGNGPTGDWGIGAYRDSVALSDSGDYMVAGPWNSGYMFSLFRGVDRPFRAYPASSATDSTSVVAISGDGAWVAMGTTGGEVLVWEVAPAVMLELTSPPVTISIPGIGPIVDLDDLRFDRHLIKPGRGGDFTEKWSIWALVGTTPIPPEAAWLVSGGDFDKEHDRNLSDGNVIDESSETMEVPRMYSASLTTISGFIFRIELTDDPSGVRTSDEGAFFADVQVATP